MNSGQIVTGGRTGIEGSIRVLTDLKIIVIFCLNAKMGGAQGQGQISNMMFMQKMLLRVRIKHQHKMCQFLFNHKSGEEGGRPQNRWDWDRGTDFLAITPLR